jgi:uncharacterized repeat protein (TIGR01451 family)
VDRRRKALRGSVALALVVFGALFLAGGAFSASIDRRGTVDPTTPFTWDGDMATGANTDYDAESGGPCGKTATDYCDITLLRVNVDPSFWNTRGGGVQISARNFTPNPGSDFDLFVYQSDASGTIGQLVGSSPNIAGVEESTTIANASGYYLVQVVYFSVVASKYSGEAKFVTRNKIPPDVDSPPGLQDRLASNPALGFRSHSEPHLAQSPLNPDILVGGSKMYNRDPDSLNEYEFKIGTYVSFNGGLTWKDQGQLDVCPPAQAPPASWPNNTCYPNEDPARDGTGPEDGNRGGGGDFGEEYITSDVWLQFDDEGNAYAMVLDSPPFPDGNGWGMSFHRWESVSADDLNPGRTTWGPKIVINNYTTPSDQALFLDDKNTFAVNNAGPDRDGQTGIMVACWGQNVPTAIKQQIVCERSTDGGRTWPGSPLPISAVDQLVIGVHVVADTQDPNTFYAIWLQYASGIAGAPDAMEMVKTINGGVTWTNPVPIAFLTGLPSTFPGQSFRNLSIPIAAVAPTGDIYLVYADYRAASGPDADGKQADIMIVKGTNGGLTWGSPVKVNRDGGNADQFQPYVAVSPSGTVNVAYFDRRNDPDNYFIDEYLSRSTNGGASFTDTRLSHDMWDPGINPPISPSGEFIGDYQALVADACNSIAFYQDTHLANDPARDPNFDSGLPRSPYQELFAWIAPTGNCPPDLAVTKTDAPDPVLAGKNLTYTVTVTNRGSGAATGVVLTDTLPAGVTFVSATASRGSCSQAGGIVTCSLNTFAKAATATVTVVVRPTQAGTITNRVSVRENEADGNPTNNSAQASTSVQPAADLAVQVSDSPDPVHIGQNLTYRVIVRNNGPSTATGVTVDDTFDKSAGFGSVSTTKGTCSLKPSKTVVTCSLGNLVNGTSATITIVVKPATKGTLTDTASVTATAPVDPNSTNNTASTTTTAIS